MRKIKELEARIHRLEIADECQIKVNGDFKKQLDDIESKQKEQKELEETNKLLSNELTKNSILKQDHIETCCGIPIFEIPKIKEENQQLKQQLAEKERQVKKLNNEAQKYFEDAYCNDSIYKDKISFCIEKFQETKKSLRDKVCLMENDEHYYPQNAVHWQDVVAIIDNQIASLKKEMK